MTETKQSAVQGSSHMRDGRETSLGTAFCFPPLGGALTQCDRNQSSPESCMDGWEQARCSLCPSSMAANRHLSQKRGGFGSPILWDGISQLEMRLACALGLHAFSFCGGSTQPGQSDPDDMSMSGSGNPFSCPGAAGCLLTSVSEVADKKGPPHPAQGLSLAAALQFE